MNNSAMERRRTAAEKYEEAALEFAMYNLLMKERDIALKPLDDETEKQLEAQYERSLLQRMAMIDRETRRQAIQIGLRKSIPQVLKITAAFILVLNLGLTIAVASSSAVRAYVVEFFVRVNDEYAEIGFYETDTAVTIPEGWTGCCYPTYIPEGYRVNQVLLNNEICSALYLDGNNQKFSFSIYNKDVLVNIDTENTEVSFTQVQGIEAVVFMKDGVASMIWPYGSQFIIINMTGSLSEISMVAESIRSIKN